MRRQAWAWGSVGFGMALVVLLGARAMNVLAGWRFLPSLLVVGGPLLAAQITLVATWRWLVNADDDDVGNPASVRRKLAEDGQDERAALREAHHLRQTLRHSARQNDALARRVGALEAQLRDAQAHSAALEAQLRQAATDQGLLRAMADAALRDEAARLRDHLAGVVAERDALRARAAALLQENKRLRHLRDGAPAAPPAPRGPLPH